MTTITLVAGWIVCGFIGLMAGTFLFQIWAGDIDISRLISEVNGDASMSRFQFLIFTFVIALSLFLVIVGNSPLKFPDIPNTVLSLLGISGSSYLVSKGIQFSDPAGLAEHTDDISISPTRAVVKYGQTQPFKADVPRKPGGAVHWQVVAGLGQISNNGVYTAPAAPAPAPAQTQYATIQVTSVDFPDASDLAVVTLA